MRYSDVFYSLGVPDVLPPYRKTLVNDYRALPDCQINRLKGAFKFVRIVPV